MTDKTTAKPQSKARSWHRAAFTIAAVSLLAGCAQVRNIEQSFVEIFEPPPPVAPTRVPVVYRGPIYCYDTIGEPDCYAQPFPRPEERFIGALVSPGDFPGAGDNGSDGGNTVPAN